MNSYKTEQRVSQVDVPGETQSLAPRQNPDSMHVSGSRVFAIGARIAVGILYFACFTAAIAQSPDQSGLGLSAVARLNPPPITQTAQASQDFDGNALATIVGASMGLTWLATQLQKTS